jgi:hypothetical protein
MAIVRYIPGALVEARSSKYGKGFGIIVTGPVMDTKAARQWRDLDKAQEWFSVHWFEKPGNLSAYYLYSGQLNSRVDMTKNQIKLVRKK